MHWPMPIKIVIIALFFRCLPGCIDDAEPAGNWSDDIQDSAGDSADTEWAKDSETTSEQIDSDFAGDSEDTFLSTDSEGSGSEDQCPDDPNKTEPGDCGCGVDEEVCSGSATFQMGKSKFLVDEPIVVNYYNLPGNPSDGIGIFSLGSPNHSPLEYQTTHGYRAGAMNFHPLPAGTYSVRLFINDPAVPAREREFSVEEHDQPDDCPEDPGKLSPGICGCGIADLDDDGDGAPDCIDACPQDKEKTQPGICGCHISDKDTDKDTTPDCKDLCPQDKNKISPGHCGCGVPDVDSDGDGLMNCLDGCPTDEWKFEPFICGCGRLEGSCGLMGDYYDSVTFGNLVLSRLDPQIDFDWKDVSPHPYIKKETFSVRWTGYLSPQYSEIYSFYTLSDSGIRLWVSNTLIVDYWTPHSATWRKGTISLVGGQLYPIKIEYFESGGAATVKLEWSSNSQEREIVPANHLYPE